MCVKLNTQAQVSKPVALCRTRPRFYCRHPGRNNKASVPHFLLIVTFISTRVSRLSLMERHVNRRIYRVRPRNAKRELNITSSMLPHHHRPRPYRPMTLRKTEFEALTSLASPHATVRPRYPRSFNGLELLNTTIRPLMNDRPSNRTARFNGTL